MLDIELNEVDLDNLERIRKSNLGLKKDLLQNKRDISKVLSLNFKDSRNKMILKAYKDVFTQKEIVDFFGISASLVSKILKSYNSTF